MSYKLCEEDRRFYAVRLQIENTTLKWSSTRGIDILIIKSQFKKNPDNDLSKVIEYMNSTEYIQYKDAKDFIKVPDSDCYIYYMKCTEYMHTLGKQIMGDSASYTIYPCIVNGSDTCIYKQSGNSMQYHIDYKTQLEVEIYKVYKTETKKNGFFGKSETKNVFSGFCKIVFSEKFKQLKETNFINDGDLFFVINGFKIPINKEVFLQEKVFIKSGEISIETLREDINLVVIQIKGEIKNEY